MPTRRSPTIGRFAGRCTLTGMTGTFCGRSSRNKTTRPRFLLLRICCRGKLQKSKRPRFTFGAMARIAQHDTEDALSDLDESIRLDPTDPVAYVHRSHIYGMNREFDKSISDATEAIRRNVDADVPTNAISYLYRGCGYGYKGEYGKAIADLSEAIRLDPKCTNAYSFRSWVYRQMGDAGKAESDATHAKEVRQKR